MTQKQIDDACEDAISKRDRLYHEILDMCTFPNAPVSRDGYAIERAAREFIKCYPEDPNKAHRLGLSLFTIACEEGRPRRAIVLAEAFGVTKEEVLAKPQMVRCAFAYAYGRRRYSTLRSLIEKYRIVASDLLDENGFVRGDIFCVDYAEKIDRSYGPYERSIWESRQNREWLRRQFWGDAPMPVAMFPKEHGGRIGEPRLDVDDGRSSTASTRTNPPKQNQNVKSAAKRSRKRKEMTTASSRERRTANASTFVIEEPKF